MVGAGGGGGFLWWRVGMDFVQKRVTFPMFNFTNGYGDWHLKYNK